jgi:hypothetical protein
LWAAALAAHLSIIAVVSCWDIVDLIGSGQTMLPQAIAAPARRLARAMSSISPRHLARSNPIRQTIVGYSHMAGIESPYTFFAPNVPASLKVVFEIEFPDKHVDYQLPRVQSDTEGMRLAALIDQAAAQPGLWRDVILHMLAASAAHMNPEATRIRVVVAALKFPPPGQYLNGAQASYQLICSYNFESRKAPGTGDGK